MKLRAAAAAALLLPLACTFPVHASPEAAPTPMAAPVPTATPSPTPSFLDKTLQALHLKGNPQSTQPKQGKEGKPTPTPTPSYVAKALESLHIIHPAQPKDNAQMHHGIGLKLAINPPAIKLSENREVQVTISLFNRSKTYLDLNFPTSQRIEVLVKDASGKVVNTWSEDQSFTNDPAAVTVNPGERLEYTVSVATREMSAGQPYTIEASFPSYQEFKIQQQVIPAK